MKEYSKTGSSSLGDTAEAPAQPQIQFNEGKGAIVAPADRRSTVQQLFADLIWKDEDTGYISCPGQDLHTGKEGPRDCQVKIDGVPTIHCVHASCVEEIQKANRALRSAMGSSAPVVPTADQKKLAAAAKAKKAQDESIKVRARKSLPSVLTAYAWPYDQIVADSLNSIREDDRLGMFQIFMGMFENEDVLWIGDVTETGQAHHVANFMTKAEWLAGPNHQDKEHEESDQ